MPGFEYRRATWDEVCALGPQGWRLVAVPPIVEMRQTLGQMVQAGEPLYVLERQAGVTVPGHVHPLGAAAAQPAGAVTWAPPESRSRLGGEEAGPGGTAG